MKAIIFACLLVVLFAASPLDKYKELVSQDTCASQAIDAIKPKIDAKLAELKADQKNFMLQVEVLSLMEQGKQLVNKCESAKPAPKFGDAVEWEGVSFLLASNCFKDAGIELILADTVIQDPTDYVNDIIVAIFGYILGVQGVKDCEQFYNFVV
jgi:hypothetical protein